MRGLLKNRKFYYILLPVLAAGWPLWTAFISLPAASGNWEKEKKQYLKAQTLFRDILELDEGRLKLADDASGAAKFDYSTEVHKTAKQAGISPGKYKLNVRRTVKVGDQHVQGANLTLESIDITRFAQFLAAIQSRWPNLQCTQLKLTQQKGLPDTWKIAIQFKYYK